MEVGDYIAHASVYMMPAILGIMFRYNLGMTEACRVIGVKLSDTDSPTGEQDAITPPRTTYATMAVWVLIAYALWVCWLMHGWVGVLVGLGVIVAASLVSGALFIPKPESRYFVRLIYGSMTRRYDGLKKRGDEVRAEAIRPLINKMADLYANTLK